MSIADELKKLAELRSQGVLSDAEFEAQKSALLSGRSNTASAATNDAPREWRDVPLAEKWWFQLIVTALANPIGLLLMLFRKSFQKTRSGEVQRVGRVSKFMFGSLGALVWALGLAGLSSGPIATGGSTSPPVAAIDACDSAEARGAVTNAVEQNASSTLDTFKLLDMRDIVEVEVLDGGKVRRCNATLVLNSGEEAVGFELSPDSTGKALLVTVRVTPYPKPAAQTKGAQSTPASALAAPNFDAFPSETLAPPYTLPNFEGDQSDYANYRTVITERASNGPNFAGRYTLVELGCGTGCRWAVAVDLADGNIIDFPLGGEEHLYLTLRYTRSSKLLSATWEVPSTSPRVCMREDFVIGAQQFQSQGRSQNPCS